MEETNTIHGKTMRSDYEDLQYHIDMVVGKIGLQKTVVLLRSFVEKAQFEPVKNNAPLLLTFLTNEAITLFDLKEEEFHTNTTTEYREARMACYHLYHKYTSYSYAKVAQVFGTGKRNIIYYKQKVDERLTIPHYYKPFIQLYDQLEERSIQFISKL